MNKDPSGEDSGDTITLQAGLRTLHDAGPELKRAISGNLDEMMDMDPEPMHRRNHSLFGNVWSNMRRGHGGPSSRQRPSETSPLKLSPQVILKSSANGKNGSGPPSNVNVWKEDSSDAVPLRQFNQTNNNGSLTKYDENYLHPHNYNDDGVIGSAESLVGKVLLEQGLGKFLDEDFIRATSREMQEAMDMTEEEMDRAAHLLLKLHDGAESPQTVPGAAARASGHQPLTLALSSAFSEMDQP